MIEIIVGIIIAIIIASVYFYLTIKIKKITPISSISIGFIVTLVLANLFVNMPIINFIIAFTIYFVLFLFFLKMIKSIFQEEIIKE